MKLKSLFILFFSIFLLSPLSQAMADEVVVTKSTVCDSVCGALTCGSAGTTHTIKQTATGTPKSITACAGATSTLLDKSLADDVKPKCRDMCLVMRSYLVGGIADADANTEKNTFTKSACNALKIATGSAGKTFATFAVIATGIGFFTGKVSWGLMIGVAAGIATMFGGTSIVAAISGNDVATGCDNQ